MRRVFLAVFLIFSFLALPSEISAEDQFDPTEMIKNWVNFTCVEFKIEGICVKDGRVGLKISYYLPVALVEVPPAPWETVLKPVGVVIKATEPAIEQFVSKIPILNKLGGYEIGGNIFDEFTDTHYRDVHIYSFIDIINPALELLPMLCFQPHVPFFVWISETDPLNWRFGFKDYLKYIKNIPQYLMKMKDLVTNFSSAFSNPVDALKEAIKSIVDKVKNFGDSLQKAGGDNEMNWKDLIKYAQEAADKISSSIPDGGWGSKTPRIGYSIDPSDVIASHLFAVRALDLEYPLKPRWMVDKFQLVYPRVSACYKIGSDRIKAETGKLSLTSDTLVWLYWYKFKCCLL